MIKVGSSSRVSFGWLDAAVCLVGLILLAAVLGLSTSAALDGGEMRTRNTVRLSLAWYTLAVLLMIRLSNSDRNIATRLGKFTRWCWTWATVCFFVHLAAAFTYYHQWSHLHAYEQTQQVSGVGEGIYALYVFVSLGLADAAWWWISPARYANRPVWIDRLLHAFMLFIVFNAMIVFESGLVRWVGVLLFVALGVAWLLQRGVPTLQLSS